MTAVWTFDRFTPGTSLGTVDWTPDRAAFATWNALFRTCPDDQATLPAGMISMVALRAYMAVLAERSRGNIHAVQTMRIAHLPALGATLRTEVRCTSAELRNGRRWLGLGTTTRLADATPCFEGAMTMLWAA